MVVLAGCVSGRAPETIKLKVHLIKDEGGKPTGVKIDKTFHDSGVVSPGDQIAWVCDCPEGTEFTVEKLHFAGDLDQLVDLFSQTESEDEIERLSQALQAGEASPGGKEEAKAEEAVGQEAIQDEEVRRLVTALKSTLAPDQARPLFENWSPPAEFVRGTETIRSTPVAQGIGHGLWKFTWRVRLTGTETEESWDPCIYGHESKPRDK